MKIDTTAVTIKNRCGQQVICINQNGPKENHDDMYPVFFKKKKGNYKGQQKMYTIMQQKSKHW